MKRLLIAAALAFGLAACGGNSGPHPLPPPVVHGDATTVDEKVMFTLEASYNTAAAAYLTLVDNGQLTGAKKAEAKAALEKAYQSLVNARRAYSFGQGDNFKLWASAVTQALTAANAAMGR